MGGDSSCLPAAQFREGKQATPPARSSCAVPTPEAFVWHTARSCGEAPAKYEVHLYSHWLAIGLGKVAAGRFVLSVPVPSLSPEVVFPPVLAGGFVLSVPAPSVLSPVVAVPVVVFAPSSVVVFAPSAKTNRQRQTIARNISEATLRTTCESGGEITCKERLIAREYMQICDPLPPPPLLTQLHCRATYSFVPGTRIGGTEKQACVLGVARALNEPEHDMNGGDGHSQPIRHHVTPCPPPGARPKPRRRSGRSSGRHGGGGQTAWEIAGE